MRLRLNPRVFPGSVDEPDELSTNAHANVFDRLLVAQAEIEELTLVSKDRALRQFGVELLW